MEEALARAEYLEDACSRMEDGEEVTGPSRPVHETLRLYGQEFRGRYMSGKQAAALRANPRLRIYDNSARFVTCCYDQSKAQCHPDRLGQLGTDEKHPISTTANPTAETSPAPTGTSNKPRRRRQPVRGRDGLVHDPRADASPARSTRRGPRGHHPEPQRTDA